MIEFLYPCTVEPKQVRRASTRPMTHNGVPVPYSATVLELRLLSCGEGPARWAAFVALGYSPDPLAVRQLVCATSAVDWNIRRAACEALGFRPRAAAATARVGELLEDPVPSVVRTACSVIGALGDYSWHDRIVNLLSHRDEAIRLTAVYTLNRLWKPDDAAILLNLVRSEPSADVCTAVATVLLRHVDVRSWRSLFELWIDSPVARNRVRACDLTTRFGNASFLDRISHLRLDRDSSVRDAVERAAARFEGRLVRRVGPLADQRSMRPRFVLEGAVRADRGF